MKNYRDEIDERIATASKFDGVDISPAYVRGTRIRATFTIPNHGITDISVIAAQLVDGSLFAASDIQSATIEQTSVVTINRRKLTTNGGR